MTCCSCTVFLHMGGIELPLCWHSLLFSLPLGFPCALLISPFPACVHIASFSVLMFIAALFCPSTLSSCPARSQSPALCSMGQWRAATSLPALPAPQPSPRSKVGHQIFPLLLFLVLFLLSCSSWNIFGRERSRVAFSSNRRGGAVSSSSGTWNNVLLRELIEISLCETA